MSSELIEKLRSIRTFPSLVKYLRDDLGWPLSADSIDELVFEYEPEELGIDPEIAVKIKEIKQLRPLAANQPWGIFYIGFEPKQLPVVVLRRILQKLVIKKRQTAKNAHRNAWELHDLLFVSSYGEENERSITFAHFSEDEESKLPTLRVIGWDSQDTPLHIDRCISELSNLAFDEELSPGKWRDQWSRAFTLKHREVISTSKALAKELAGLAARIRKRVNKVLAIESEKGPMRQLYKAFQQTLVHDLSEDDFADMYAQTITYGLFTTKKSRPAGLVAENLVDMVPRTNPFLRELLSTFLTVGGRTGKIDFDELGINDVVQALRDTDMDAVMRDFGDSKPEEDPVIHFYEDFLKEYDAQKKVKRGVFYTPKPVVSFIVRSVHEILQKEFGLEDGLADTTTWGEMAKRNKDIKIPDSVSENEPFVQILDPAVGTGTFLVEVIDIVCKTMKKKWEKAEHLPLEFAKLWNEYVPRHLLPRLYGFELMMAPYAIAHMKIGLKLFETGYQFGADERARIYLTNSLEPPQDFSDRFEFDAPALAHEAKAVNMVKRHQHFTVVIGNPPYAGMSVNRSVDQNNKPTFVGRLIENYRQVDGKPLGERNPKMLQDDYVKFIRLAQWVIDNASLGVMGYITNHAYLDNPTFRGMRQSLSHIFKNIVILNLHGNTRRRERSPSNGLDENVFDIQQGVAVFLGVRDTKLVHGNIGYDNIWGERKIKYDKLNKLMFYQNVWQKLSVSPPFFLFSPQNTDLLGEYNLGVKITDIFPLNSVGIDTGRDGLTIQWTQEDIYRVVNNFATLSPEEARVKYNLGEDTVEWKVELAQRDLKTSRLSKENVHPILYRPFDVRHTYYTGKSRGFHCRPRIAIMQHMLEKSNLALITVRQQSQDGMPWTLVGVTNKITERCAISNKTKEANYLFPLFSFCSKGNSQASLGFPEGHITNFSSEFLRALARRLDIETIKTSGLPKDVKPEIIFNYIYALLYSLIYRTRYAEFLKIDFPRLPLTSSIKLFYALSKLGGELVSLHLMESAKLDKPITKWWGATPSGEVEKVIWSDDTVWINKSKTEGFKGVTENVWNFHIGGYQVCEKWLKDRKGRKLSKEDIEHYHKIVVALNETIRIMKEIDEVIAAHGGWPIK